jgi:hypothetical protein
VQSCEGGKVRMTYERGGPADPHYKAEFCPGLPSEVADLPLDNDTTLPSPKASSNGFSSSKPRVSAERQHCLI